MYPTLKLVECPKCGSPHKQPLGADLYRCADCGMHYHLDWVGTGVQVRQPTAPLPSPTAHCDWLPLKVLLVVVLAIVLLVGVSFWAAAGARA
jgi:DNA-directed RNA polymerase subunit RPC12/RpoP